MSYIEQWLHVLAALGHLFNIILCMLLLLVLHPVRDFIEGPRIINPIFAHNTTQLPGSTNGSVLLHRRYISNSTALDVVLTPNDASTQMQVGSMPYHCHYHEAAVWFLVLDGLGFRGAVCPVSGTFVDDLCMYPCPDCHLSSFSVDPYLGCVQHLHSLGR